MKARMHSCNCGGGLINSPEGSRKGVSTASLHRKLEISLIVGTNREQAYEGLTSKGLVANKIYSYAE